MTSGFTQLVVGIAVGFILLATPLFFRFLSSLSKDVREIKGVLITPAPTPLVPHPPKGLVDNVADLLRDSKPDNGSSSRDVLDRIDEATKE